ncbi:TM0106 family RecB-like putative nuclease [bacterium]|nr:MAG: TM0106 family RecB-like putative nuclease [bacterium]
MQYITASKLYDYIKCPHKVWRDVYGPQEEKSQEPNDFIQLLWKKGVKHEKDVVSKLGDFVDLEKGTLDERFEKTIQAMKDKAPLIYQGVLKYDNVLGIPDLLKKLPNGSYMPIDIKSGMGFDSADEELGEEGKPKKHYAVQLCLYNELLKKLEFATHDTGTIIDVNTDKVVYDLNSQMGLRDKRTWWEFYRTTKGNVELLIAGKNKNKPALLGTCKICPWHASCKKWCQETKDLTNIFCFGRSIRDRINEDLFIDDIDDFLNMDVDEIMEQKKKEIQMGNKEFLYRVGENSLLKAIKRAKIFYQTKKPVFYNQIVFPKTSYELFFDIEDDPTQEFVYLHGVYQRKGGEEKFIDFTAKENTRESEKKAWSDFWDYINSLPKNDFSVYYYSPHEKSVYRRLQKRYPDVVSMKDVNDFFDNPNTVDLYTKHILKETDWPLTSYSVKSIAQFLGFQWEDENPSGAASIEWYNRYVETKDPAVLKRILIYNKDDCKAMMVIKDEIERMQRGD